MKILIKETIATGLQSWLIFDAPKPSSWPNPIYSAEIFRIFVSMWEQVKSYICDITLDYYI